MKENSKGTEKFEVIH